MGFSAPRQKRARAYMIAQGAALEVSRRLAGLTAAVEGMAARQQDLHGATTV